MTGNKKRGTDGEVDMVNKIPCPNCGKSLMSLPPNYPLYDLQCVGCSFRAQVKTISSKPKKLFFGAGWDIMEKVLKSGFMVPPLFANFVWEDGGSRRQEVRFYPFIPKKNLKKYQLSEKARRANYRMFLYSDMDQIPFLTLYKTK